jgi:hypothetical protein
MRVGGAPGSVWTREENLAPKGIFLFELPFLAFVLPFLSLCPHVTYSSTTYNTNIHATGGFRTRNLSKSSCRWPATSNASRPTNNVGIGKGKGKAFPLQAWAGPWGSGRLRLRIFSTFGTMKVVRSSPLRTGRLHPHEFSWYSFLEAESTPRYMFPSVASEKIPSDTTGDRSRNPPTSSTLP